MVAKRSAERQLGQHNSGEYLLYAVMPLIKVSSLVICPNGQYSFQCVVTAYFKYTLLILACPLLIVAIVGSAEATSMTSVYFCITVFMRWSVCTIKSV